MGDVGINGQPVLSDGSSSLVWIDLPNGVRVKVHRGFADVAAYIAQRWHREVEPLKAGQCWGYSYRPANAGGGAWSSHSTGWALDLNSNGAGSMLWGASTLKATDAQLAAMNRIQDDLGMVWGGPTYAGGDYSKPQNWDPMHWDIPKNLRDPAAWCRDALAKAPPIGGTVPPTHPNDPAEDTMAAGPIILRKGSSVYYLLSGNELCPISAEAVANLQKQAGVPMAAIPNADWPALSDVYGKNSG